MKYKIFFTDTAKSDLREIAFYIAGQAKNKETAIKFVGELREQCGQLADFPLSGACPADRVLKSAGYRYLVHKEYLIFYFIEEESRSVFVSAVFNAKKDYMRVFKNMI